jgi:N-acetyl-alpha-D-muramate 1-phosphate uridylyltransferase
MQAVILAGGLATRMRPLTLNTPKALLDVAGRPFIAWQLERLAECGYTDVVVCVGFLGERVREFVGDGGHFDLKVRFSDDGPRLLGTAGAVRAALNLLAPSFLVTYGDSYLPFDYAAPLRDLEQNPEALGTMSVFRNAGQWDSSNTAVAGNRVLGYEKGSREAALDHIDYGALALRRSVIERLAVGETHGLDSILTELAQRSVLRAYTAEQRFYEIGSAEGLRDLEEFLRNQAKA